MKKSKKRVTHFVPRVVFETAFAGVVPVCVAATECASDATGGPAPSEAGGIVPNAIPTSMPPGVALECFGGTTFSCRCGSCMCLAPGAVCPGPVPVGSSQPKIVLCSGYEGGIPNPGGVIDDCPDAYILADGSVNGPFCCVPVVAPSDASVDASHLADGGDASARADMSDASLSLDATADGGDGGAG